MYLWKAKTLGPSSDASSVDLPWGRVGEYLMPTHSWNKLSLLYQLVPHACFAGVTPAFPHHQGTPVGILQHQKLRNNPNSFLSFVPTLYSRFHKILNVCQYAFTSNNMEQQDNSLK